MGSDMEHHQINIQWILEKFGHHRRVPWKNCFIQMTPAGICNKISVLSNLLSTTQMAVMAGITNPPTIPDDNYWPAERRQSCLYYKHINKWKGKCKNITCTKLRKHLKRPWNTFQTNHSDVTTRGLLNLLLQKFFKSSKYKQNWSLLSHQCIAFSFHIL